MQEVQHYLKNFKDIEDCIFQDVPYVNILMVGATGSGKSSIVNTFVTAVTSSDRIKQPHRVHPSRSKNAKQKV